MLHLTKYVCDGVHTTAIYRFGEDPTIDGVETRHADQVTSRGWLLLSFISNIFIYEFVDTIARQNIVKIFVSNHFKLELKVTQDIKTIYKIESQMRFSASV